MTFIPIATPRMSKPLKALHTTERDAVMTLVGNVKMSRQEFDAIACRFLGCEFTGQIYADWPIDLRLPVHNETVERPICC